MPIFKTFIELMKSYLDSHKREANVLHVTPQDEHAILSALGELPEGLQARVMTEGVRGAFPKIFGLRTVWDAAQTKVEVETSSPVGFR
jgi:hypothetical protein